jgi:hypothetical protein
LIRFICWNSVWLTKTVNLPYARRAYKREQRGASAGHLRFGIPPAPEGGATPQPFTKQHHSALSYCCLNSCLHYSRSPFTENQAVPPVPVPHQCDVPPITRKGEKLRPTYVYARAFLAHGAERPEVVELSGC